MEAQALDPPNHMDALDALHKKQGGVLSKEELYKWLGMEADAHAPVQGILHQSGYSIIMYR